MASLDFEAEKAAFREYYNDNHDLLNGALDFFQSLISSLLSNTNELEKPSVTSRLKEREESIGKFSLKYQTTLEENKTAYEIKDHITDILGFRVVCLYENEVENIIKVLRDNFEVLGETNKIKTIESTENSFGYKGFHLDLKINKTRKDLLEYSPYQDLRFEVQVRTTIQDAWSALDHKIKYKKSIPADLKRRINTLAALFELADHEFLSIRDKTKQLLDKAKTETISSSKNSINVTVDAAETPNKQNIAPPDLDVFSFISAVQSHFPNYNFFSYSADSFVQEILKLKNGLNAEFLRAAMNRRVEKVRSYKDQSPYRLNPYTEIRHCLYLEDKESFKTCLFDKQRAQFDDWAASNP